MTKPYQTLILFVISVFFLSLVYTAQSEQGHFEIRGQVYCDPCRAHFVTKLSTFLKGATVRLECRNREQDTNLTLKGEEATTDNTGTYHISVDGDYEDDICEVKLVKSPDPDCSEISVEKYFKDAARISLAANSGMATDARMANPLGFLKKVANPECEKLLADMGIHSNN
ncbi:olee1-like protein [Apium graveolens]|uniref:olee1-like protein n=1 Tax=Apium graveolens TaxID=4045 RepID=UPI003D78F0E4